MRAEGSVRVVGFTRRVADGRLVAGPAAATWLVALGWRVRVEDGPDVGPWVAAGAEPGDDAWTADVVVVDPAGDLARLAPGARAVPGVVGGGAALAGRARVGDRAVVALLGRFPDGLAGRTDPFAPRPAVPVAVLGACEAATRARRLVADVGGQLAETVTPAAAALVFEGAVPDAVAALPGRGVTVVVDARVTDRALPDGPAALRVAPADEEGDEDVADRLVVRAVLDAAAVASGADESDSLLPWTPRAAAGATFVLVLLALVSTGSATTDRSHAWSVAALASVAAALAVPSVPRARQAVLVTLGTAAGGLVAVGGMAELGARSGVAALLGFLATFLGSVVLGAGVASALALLRAGTRP